MQIRSINKETSVLPVKKEIKEKKADEPQDGFVSSALKEEPVLTKEMVMSQVKPQKGKLAQAHAKGIETASEWTEKVGGVVGGAAGIGAVIPGLYAGIIGGSVAGGIAGLSLGPAVAVLSGAQGLSFAGTVFSTVGPVAKAAIVAGTACAAVGAGVVGYKAGKMLSGIPIGAVGYPVGFAQGLAGKGVEESGEVQEKPEAGEKPKVKIKHEDGFITKTAEGLLGATGLITGGLGGAAIGAGIGAGTALTAGVIAENLTWSTLGVGGAVGAVVGGVLLGAMSAYGGYTIADKTSKALNWAKNKIMPDKDQIALQQVRQEVAEKEAQFKELGAKVDGLAKETQNYFSTQSAVLDKEQAGTKEYIDTKEAELAGKKAEAKAYIDGEQAKLNKQEADVQAADANIEGIINKKRDEIFAEIRKPTDEKYASLHGELDAREQKDKTRDEALKAKERTQAELIEDKTVASYKEKMVPVNKKYDDLHKEQDVREQGFNEWDKKLVDGNKALDEQIKTDGLKDYQQREPGLIKEYDNKEDTLRGVYRQKTDDASRKHQQDMQNLSSQHNSNIDALEKKYGLMMTSIVAQEASLMQEKGNLEIQNSNVSSQVYTAQSEEREADYKLRDAKNREEQEVGSARRERDEAVSDKNSKQSELNNINSRINQARQERQKFVSQKAQVDARIPGLESEKSRLESQLAGMKK